VLHNFDAIHRRVLDGTAIQTAEEEKEREERKQRIQKMNDLTNHPITNEEKDISFKGDPFRPVNEILVMKLKPSSECFCQLMGFVVRRNHGIYQGLFLQK
jgi:hypothetical protein